MAEQYAMNIATDQDREAAWRHAFAYADAHESLPDGFPSHTDAAADYANHYSAVVSAEDDMMHWPDHGAVFPAWRWGQK